MLRYEQHRESIKRTTKTATDFQMSPFPAWRVGGVGQRASEGVRQRKSKSVLGIPGLLGCSNLGEGVEVPKSKANEKLNTPTSTPPHPSI